MYALSVIFNNLASIDIQTLLGYFEENPGLIAVIALIITVAFFIIERINERLTRNKENKERTTRSCNAILNEIEDHRDTLRNPNLRSEYVIRGQDIRYNIRVLTTDAFESILHSGLFTNFRSETQNSLTNLYLRIRLRNQFILYLSQFRDTFFLYDNSPRRHELYLQKIYPYEDMLTNLDREINTFLDGVSILIRTKELPK